MKRRSAHKSTRAVPLHALLMCNGVPPARSLCRRLAREADFIVAADGGADTLRRYGLRPEVIIGDLDSVSAKALRAFHDAHIVRIRSQDSTDLEKALDYLKRHGVTRVTIIGATGNRLDFTLGNLSVFWNYAPGMEIVFRGDGWAALPAGLQRSLKARKGTTISLIPFGRCSGITLRGLRYPLRNAVMEVGEIGVSNVVEKSPFSVSVRRGRMLLLILTDTPII